MKHSLTFLLLILLCFIGSIKINAQSTLALSIDSSRLVVYDEFDVKLQVENVSNLFAISFDLRFDTTLFDFVSSTENQLLSEDGAFQTLFMTSEQGDKIIFGITRLEPDEGGVSTAERSTFASLTFKVRFPGTGLFSIENAKFIDPQLYVTYPTIENDTILIISPPELKDSLTYTILPNETLSIYLDSLVVDLDTPTNELEWEITHDASIEAWLDTLHMTLNIRANQPFANTQLHIKVTDPEALMDETHIQLLQPSAVTSFKEDLVSFSAYPNPFTDHLTIILKGKQIINKPKISIYSIEGSKVCELTHYTLSASNEYVFKASANDFCNDKTSSEQYILIFESDNLLKYKRIAHINP